MKTEKKYFLDPEDGIETAKMCLENAKNEAIIINIPARSVIGKKLKNFRDLKDMSDKNNVDLLIESTDDHILESASANGLEAVNPVFKVKERAVSDIVPISKRQPKIIETEPEESLIENEEKEHEKPDVSVIFTSKANSEKKKKLWGRKEKNNAEKSVFDNFDDVSMDDGNETQKQKRNKKAIFIFGSAVIVLFIAIWGILSLLPRAEINIVLKKATVEFDEKLEVSINATVPNANSESKTIIPGEMFTAKKNVFLPIESDKTEQVEEKAKGTLTVYNFFSASPQTLVKTTRFESPDGTIFRLDKEVTIPGAKSENGILTPSEIEVSVTADKSGEASNLSPTKNWTIPGFKGTSRYTKFSAENKSAMTGGFIGNAPVASDEQKAKSSKEAEDTLSALLKSEMLVMMSEEFKLIDGSDSFRITKQETQTLKDESNSFGIFTEGEMKRIVFKEEMLKETLFKKYHSSYGEEGITAFSFEINYGEPAVNLSSGTMTVPIKGKIVYAHKTDSDALKLELKGKNESEFRRIIFALPGVENATIVLSPFWVSSIPKNTNKIIISIE